MSKSSIIKKLETEAGETEKNMRAKKLQKQWRVVAIITLVIVVVVTAALFIRDYYVKQQAQTMNNQTVSESVSGAARVVPGEDFYGHSEETPIDLTVNDATSAEPVMVVQTAKGDIRIKLYKADVPVAVASMTQLSKKGFYDGTTFHRVEPGFVIQGGDRNSLDDNPANDGTGGPGYRFDDEITKNHQHVPGTVALANAGPHTNGSQFYIVTTKEQPYLDGSYVVVGEVISGMDVVLAVTKGDVMQKVYTEESSR